MPWKVPAQIRELVIPPALLSRNPFHPSRHFAGGPPRKGDEKDASRIGTIHNEMGDPISQRVGFS